MIEYTVLTPSLRNLPNVKNRIFILFFKAALSKGKSALRQAAMAQSFLSMASTRFFLSCYKYHVFLSSAIPLYRSPSLSSAVLLSDPSYLLIFRHPSPASILLFHLKISLAPFFYPFFFTFISVLPFSWIPSHPTLPFSPFLPLSPPSNSYQPTSFRSHVYVCLLPSFLTDCSFLS